MKRNLIWFAPLFLIATGALLFSFQAPQGAHPSDVKATLSHGVLHVVIPYAAPRSGSGTLTVDVLNPEDRPLARVEEGLDLKAGKGTWREDLKFAQALPMDDLVWHRLRYRFIYGDEKEPAIAGIDSISEILRMPVLRVIGQQSYLAGTTASMRLVVTDSKNETVAGASSVRIELTAPNHKPILMFEGPLDRRGTTDAQVRFPAGVIGTATLHYVVDTPIGSTEAKQQIRIEDQSAILLTTEKPLYQPGQTIHVRALALNRATHEATAGRNLTFEVQDSRGNKVFRQSTQTSKFGIASAEFTLADEVNLGTYHLRAVMDSRSAELALDVEKYVLPKFKVAVDLAGKEQEARHGYRPGDRVTGTVHANYFFGKPVDDAELTVKASGMDVAVYEVASVEGKTDANGDYRFDLKLPDYFAGHPLDQGTARVLIEATVRDSAGHSETRGEPITVSESPLIVSAIPEGGTLIPGLENQVFILTSYADGKPASTTVRVQDQTATTDAGGIAVVRIKPSADAETLHIEASDKEGNRASSAVKLEVRPNRDQILLRTERAVYRAGDRIALEVFSTSARGTAYIDVIREGQTILTRDVDIRNGRAELALTATPEMAGALSIDAYQFGRDAQAIADHRLVFVQPADELKIEATTDAPAYKPGDDASIRFRVTNSKGQGVQAALGLQVVDEAVFALAEKRPGFAKVFFYLEQEAMKPRYEIHSIGMSDIVEPVEHALVEQRDRAARALFAATELVNGNHFETEQGRTVPQAQSAAYLTRYRTQLFAELGRVAPGDFSRTGDLALRDAWGTKLREENYPWPRHSHFLVRSAGPDKQFDTSDDLVAYVEVRTRGVVDRPDLKSFDLNVEHDRGPFNGLAEIAGEVKDQTGAAVSGAIAEAREISTGQVRRAVAGADGQFRLAGLPAGDYEVQVSQAGFQLASRNFSLQARDRAVISAVLEVAMATEVVAVEPPPQPPPMAIMAAIGGGVRHKAERGAFEAVEPVNLGMAMPAGMIPVAGRGIARVSTTPAPHVRSWFPEALYINPEIITDENGAATISIPIADSITTWRMAMMASTTHGALGSSTGSLKVFQDFFVDLDLPVTLTEGDRVDIPVALYNYTGAKGAVELKLKRDDWFALAGDVAEKSLEVETDRTGASHFSIEAKRIGKFKLTLSARLRGATDRADIVVREIEVIPNGREKDLVFNGRLETAEHHDLNFPATAIPDASAVIVRLYPGPLSQVIEGMDAILRMPYGCFEQTSSSTWPNVLALDYMKHTGKLTPEVHAKAEGFIANGYQRLLTFEVPGGGFSWFGNAPANKILTAYGLMEFSDMAQVHDVDPKVIQRTQEWLANEQQTDGSWKPDTGFINEGATNRYNSDLLRITAYIAWSLETTGYKGPAIDQAAQYVEAHLRNNADSYTLAVLANFAVDYGKDREFTHRTMQALLDARTEKDEQAWWTAEETGVFGRGESASVETTGLAVQALLKWGEASNTASKALRYIASKKDASGTWGTTQATILALRALLLASGRSAADVRGTVEVSLNGKTVQTLNLTADNNDLLHQFVFKKVDAAANRVDLQFTGKGGLAYQVVGRWFVPWSEKAAGEALSIAVNYDRTHLQQDDIASATATITNNLPRAAKMVMVDLGIPPGFDLLSEDLQDYQEKSAARASGRLEKFSQTVTQAILYFDGIAPGDTVTLHYRLRARYPIRARTFQSRVYEYYDPEVSAVARPIELEVAKRH